MYEPAHSMCRPWYGKSTHCLTDCLAVKLQHERRWLTVRCTTPNRFATVIVQACVSTLTRLTRLDAAFIATPLNLPALDGLLAGLPALQGLDLRFRTHHHPPGTEPISNTDGLGHQPQNRERQDGFPHSLLRWVLHTAIFGQVMHRAAA